MELLPASKELKDDEGTPIIQAFINQQPCEKLHGCFLTKNIIGLYLSSIFPFGYLFSRQDNTKSTGMSILTAVSSADKPLSIKR